MGFLWIIAMVGALGVAGYKWRGFRVVAILLALAVAIVFALMQQFGGFSTAGGGSPDTSIIRDYQLDYTVAADGNQRLVETLDVEFTESKHGIFRFFDEADGVDADVTHPVTVESIQRCTTGKGTPKCVDEPYDEYYEDGFLVAKIGSADKTYPAGTLNRYVITSTTQNVITQPRGSAADQWYWNVVAQGWAMPINRAQVTVTFPVAPTQVRCITETGACETAQADGPQVVTGTYASLPPRTPVTWQADLPPVGLTAVPVGAPETSWWQSWFLLIPGALLGLLFAFGIRTLRERPASEAPVFAEPTKDILPAVWTYQEEAPKNAFQTMLLQLKQLGAVQVEVQQQGQYMATNPEWIRVWRTPEPLPMIAGASNLVDGLGLSTPGAATVIAKNDDAIGRQVQLTDKAVARLADHSAQAMGYYRPSAWGVTANIIATVLPLLSMAITIVFSAPWLGLALLIPAVVGLWVTRSMRTRLTDDGLAVRDQVSGLHTALSTPASVERFDYALKARYFGQYLPWAVALNCADKWADACKPDFPQDDPRYYQDPVFMSAWNTYSTSQVVSTAVASVSAGAIAAYAATQSSSSGGGGGGGGFSSGGGSGGGGGGSW